MSGGAIGNYCYYQVGQFVDDLEVEIENNTRPDDYGCAHNYPEEVLAIIRKEIPNIRRIAEVMRHIDFLYAGDHGESSFMKHMKKLSGETE